MPRPNRHHLATTLIVTLTALLSLNIGVSHAADTLFPVSILLKDPFFPNGDNSWYVTPVEATISAIDLESGLKEINYSINGGAWNKTIYENTLNLAPNPSFELPNLTDWTPTLPTGTDGMSQATQDPTTYSPGFALSSAKIVSTTGGWHGINHKEKFAVTKPLNNMTASVWIKTQNVLEGAYFKVYALYNDSNGMTQSVLLTKSDKITGTKDWSLVSKSFYVNVDNVIGVYLDLGLDGIGTMWADAVAINDSVTLGSVKFNVSQEGTIQIRYYTVDQAGNIEPTKTSNFKIDRTPPSEWRDMQLLHKESDPEYFFRVKTSVADYVSGLSDETDKFQYKTERTSDYGIYSNILDCNSTWKSNAWKVLDQGVQSHGSSKANLITQRVNFCNNDWGLCKYVRFYAVDEAGNVANKSFCINGPWLQVTGKGIVKANAGINMQVEAPVANTDGLIESGNYLIDTFVSSQNWMLRDNPVQISNIYDETLKSAKNVTTITNLGTNSGNYLYNNDLTISSANLPGNYSSQIFTQVIFVNGNLTIDTNINVDTSSSVLFVVKGDVNISKTVTNISSGIFSNQTISTAYNAVTSEVTNQLVLKGMFTANKFNFQRSMFDNSNAASPAEHFIYDPKLLIKLKPYLGKDQIIWTN